ncbi:MAG: DinB family protein [Pyrinomonadaceae bacterium]
MNTVETLRDLFRHMEWADAIVWQAVFASPSASGDEVLKGRLHHSHMVQRAFLNVWRGVPHTRNAGEDFNLPELAQWARENHVLASEYVNKLTEPALDQPMQVPWAGFLTKSLGHEPAVPSLGETVLQVAAHSTYHRGQINTRLRELGTEPPLTDFIAWIWFGKPPAEW